MKSNVVENFWLIQLAPKLILVFVSLYRIGLQPFDLLSGRNSLYYIMIHNISIILHIFSSFVSKCWTYITQLFLQIDDRWVISYWKVSIMIKLYRSGFVFTKHYFTKTVQDGLTSISHWLRQKAFSWCTKARQYSGNSINDENIQIFHIGITYFTFISIIHPMCFQGFMGYRDIWENNFFLFNVTNKIFIRNKKKWIHYNYKSNVSLIRFVMKESMTIM